MMKGNQLHAFRLTSFLRRDVTKPGGPRHGSDCLRCNGPVHEGRTGNRYRKELVNSLDGRNAIDPSLANPEVPSRRGGTTLSLNLQEARRCSLTQAPDYQASFRANWNWRAS